MRRWLFAVVAVLQVLVLAYMAAEREWISRTGEQVFVRTAPIDPRDPMRGDYVRLTYEISTVPRALCRDGLAEMFLPENLHRRDFRDRRVHASLVRDAEGIVSIESLSDREPEGGLHLRGRVEWCDAEFVAVRWGIEALFTEQGAALRFEEEARGEKAGVPVNAEVALSDRGVAVLRGYRWEPLGITCELRRAAPAPVAFDAERRTRPGIVGATVTLKNHSDAPVAIVDLPGGASFRLVPVDRWNDEDYEPVERVALPQPRDADVVLLQPGQTHVVELDLTGSEWFVSRVVPGVAASEPPRSLETMVENWGAWFRIEYAPPPAEACVGLSQAAAIRHARLRTRSFGAGGGFD